MIVCLCKGVSSRTILDEARRGACTLKQIRQSCQAGTGCGACVQQIRQLIETVTPRHEHHNTPGPADDR
ncbi:(2Fe-2S)-binding protein [Nannocystis sp.]|uniref:(2Fe-2S)-binding protein n=1 Tax=Nannocystis sp. TaxID=1962667 RepID=UPI0024237ADA|nr:(2Fe-2S)-binding protein [Nannocystis sp.]MBK7824640.1 (2Fe-2S)-binding protein [Nannocystis sp.]MBK9753109.1 (2Fe-2S)-binding protein [Nannocystis sp.]